MSTINITFIYNSINEIIIECKSDELMYPIYKRYAIETKKNIKNLYFLYNGDKINPEEKLSDIAGDAKMINMLVNNLFDEEDKNEIVLKQSKDIICPICSEICLINLNDYKITFSDCKNGHRFTKTMFNEFLDFQKIDESKIVCNKCEGEDKTKKNKSVTINNKFFKCLTCNINLCPICKIKHSKIKESKNHKIIDYDNKHYSSYHKNYFIYELIKKKRIK